jgi:hypothetical protein
MLKKWSHGIPGAGWLGTKIYPTRRNGPPLQKQGGSLAQTTQVHRLRQEEARQPLRNPNARREPDAATGGM